ncbi:MAG: protein kinase [Terriglobia bacterium]
MIGKTISHYRIVEKLGGGGMGVVYKGRDTLLDRPVAIKVLSPELLADETAARGFIREAKAASALNHPNILTVHDLLEAEGVHFLVMEFVEGQTLRGRIGKKGMELKPLLDVSLEVAEALAAAHRARIVHRDLKPENIMVRTDGHIKVVDFGLAKLLPTRARVLATGESTILLPGVPLPAPGAGIEQTHIAGTLPYMSPEQLTGKPLDQRTDIYSFGVVLYEMATGQQPHQGRTTAEIVESILTKEPRPATDLSRVVPDKLQEIIGKTMEKDPADRYQHMEDVAVDLRRVKRVTDSGRPLPSLATLDRRDGVVGKLPSNWRLGLTIAALVLLIAVVAVVVYLYTRPPRVESALVAKWGKDVGSASLSPDGKLIAFDSDTTGQNEIYLMLLATEGQAKQITEGPGGGEARQLTAGPGEKFDPRFSPDGTQLLYIEFNADTNGAEIWTIPTLGGSARKLLPNAESADWSPDGKQIVYTRIAPKEPGSLWICSSDLSDAHKIWTSQYEDIFNLCWSPDGKWIFFEPDEGPMLITPDGTSRKRVIVTSEEPGKATGTQGEEYLGDVAWSSDSQHLFYVGELKHFRRIWKYRVPDGPSVPVTNGPSDFDPMPLPTQNGLIYASGGAQQTLWLGSPTKQQVGATVTGESFPAISPDGKQVAYVEGTPAGSETGLLWTAGIDGQNRVKRGRSEECNRAVWSPDGSKLAYTAAVPPKTSVQFYQIFVTSLPENTTRQVTSGSSDNYVQDWRPDGNALLFVRTIKGKRELRTLELETGKEFLVGVDFANAKYSRNGRWIVAVPKQEGLWIFPCDGGKETKILSQNVAKAVWALQDHAVIYSLVGKRKGQVELWKLPVADGKPSGSPTLFLRFAGVTGGEQDWDVTNDLHLAAYTRANAQADFYKMVSVK